MTTMLRDSDQVVGYWRPPFAMTESRAQTFLPGMTLGQMAARMEGLPPDFMERGVIAIGGHEIDRDRWARVKPRPGQKITFHYPLAGGGDRDSGKSGIFGIIIAIASILTAGAIVAFGVPFLGAGFAAGTLGAKALAAGVTLVGSLAASALSAPPASAPARGESQSSGGAASIAGNVLSPGAPIPAVIGTRRIFPVLASQPLIYRDGETEVGEGVYVLAGPHKLEDIRVADAQIGESDDITFETREGWGNDAPLSLVKRYGLTRNSSLELSKHAVEVDEQDVLQNQVDPTRSLPVFHGFNTSQRPDEIWLHLVFPAGLFDTESDERYGVPYRVRMRKTAQDPWINLPEIHYHSKRQEEIRPTIELIWGDGPENIPTVNENEAWVAAYKHVDGQTSPNPQSPAWTADPSFSAGSGNDALYRGNEGASNVRRVTLIAEKATFYIDEQAIPKGRYQVEIKRGMAYRAASFTKSTYMYNGEHIDFFWYTTNGGQAVIVSTQEDRSDRCAVARFCSVVNQLPIPEQSGLAAVAVRVRGRQVDNLSVLASGYVRDWDGSGWNTWTTTSNPAPHFRKVLNGPLTPDPIDEEVIDDASIVAFRQACIDNGYTCDMVVEGEAIDDVLRKITGCGYGRPRMSETWGVLRDHDRSGDDPEQVFTSRNATPLSMAKAFPRLPDAFRVVWFEASEDDAQREKIVFRPGRENTLNPLIEQVEYPGLDSEAKATARALFDLKQAELRSAFWSFQAPAEAIRVTRGDLIALNQDTIDEKHASARIIDVDVENDQVVGVWLDSKVPVYNVHDWFASTDILSEPDVFLLGVESSLGIRKSDGLSSIYAIDGETGETDFIKFDTPVPVALDTEGEPVIRPDCLAWVGEAGKTYRRLVVAGMTYDADQKASIVAVDEAPELFA